MLERNTGSRTSGFFIHGFGSKIKRGSIDADVQQKGELGYKPKVSERTALIEVSKEWEWGDVSALK